MNQKFSELYSNQEASSETLQPKTLLKNNSIAKCVDIDSSISFPIRKCYSFPSNSANKIYFRRILDFETKLADTTGCENFEYVIVDSTTRKLLHHYVFP